MIPYIFTSMFSRRTWKYIPFIILAILLFLLYGFYRDYRNLKDQVDTYKSQIENNGKVKNFQDNSGRWHSNTKPVVIQSDKALKTIAKSDSNLILLQSEIKGLKRDLRNVLTANIMTTTNNTYLEADLKDSVAVINDTLKYLIQKFEKITPWLVEKGEIADGKIKIERTTYDTIMVAVYTRKKWFLGKSHIEVEGVTRNPDNRICIKTSIIKKRRGRKI